MARPGTFKKGVSGNRKGRPKEDVDIKALCRLHSAEAVETLVKWMRSQDSKASPTAAERILNRAWGMPTQEHEVSGKDGTPLIPVINFGKKPTDQ